MAKEPRRWDQDFREKAARFYTGDCQFAICGYNRRAIMPSVPPKLIIEPGRAGRNYWRDFFSYVVPFIVQFGLYISPVGFSSAMVPAKWRLLYDFNPMAGSIDGFCWPISNGRSLFPRQGLLLSLVTIALLPATSICYFRKTERTFTDVI